MAATIRVLAAAAAAEEFDLLLAGLDTSDGQGGAVAAGVAALLGLPLLSTAAAIEPDPAAGRVRVRRLSAKGYDVIEAPMPAVISCTQALGAPRYPSLKGIMAARSREIAQRSVAEVGDAGRARAVAPGRPGLRPRRRRPPVPPAASCVAHRTRPHERSSTSSRRGGSSDAAGHPRRRRGRGRRPHEALDRGRDARPCARRGGGRRGRRARRRRGTGRHGRRPRHLPAAGRRGHVARGRGEVWAPHAAAEVAPARRRGRHPRPGRGDGRWPRPRGDAERPARLGRCSPTRAARRGPATRRRSRRASWAPRRSRGAS